MHSLHDIRERSLSSRELVVQYVDAIEALTIFQERGTRVLGWEGWLLHADGSVSPSHKYQGTADLESLSASASASAAAILAKATIMQAHTEWQERPEVHDAALYFCLTVEGCEDGA